MDWKADPVRPVAPREDEKARIFATAIIEAAKRLGITPATGSMTGPEVLLLLQEIESLAAAPVPCAASPADRAYRLLREISERLAKRRAPQVGTCASCGHRQEMAPMYQPLASSMATKQWECQSCGGQIYIFATIGGDEPTEDEDIAALLELARPVEESHD